MKSEWSAAPIATLLSVVPRDVSVSARASSRGDMRHAENCGHAMRARSGVGWQGGNWLLISRVNLFVPDEILPVLAPGPVAFPVLCRRHVGMHRRDYENRKRYCPGTEGPSIHGLARQACCRAFLALAARLRAESRQRMLASRMGERTPEDGRGPA